MRLSVIISIIIGLVILFLIGWGIYRFLHPNQNTQQQEITDKDEDNPSNNSTNSTNLEEDSQSTNSTNLSNPEEEEQNKNKWKEFKFSKKANITKINNDIAIDEANKFSNPDFEELFKQPVEINRSLFTDDNIDNKYDISDLSSRSYELYMNIDTSNINTKKEEFVNINELDTVDNFTSSFRDIEKQLANSTIPTIEQSTIPTIKLIDNEVFGY